MRDPAPLRVIDFGTVTPLRSQTLWHAIAYGVSDGTPPTLSFARPSGAYVGIGYHRHLDEVDEKYCRAENLPIYRRMVGGGPVYLDADQLFFQICLPASAISPSRVEAIRSMLAPAVVAFRTAGVDASLDENLEICVGDRKVCGHGAGQIEGSVVVCGNLIQRFDHERATRILHLPSELMRDETERLMRRYVVATPTHAETFRQAMVAAYATMLQLPALAGGLTAQENAELARLDAQFESPEWITGDHVRPRSGPRQVKVRAGVWVFEAEDEGARVVATVVDGVVEHVRLRARGLRPARLRAAEQSVTGLPVAQVPDVLASYGRPGLRLAAALATADGKRL